MEDILDYQESEPYLEAMQYIERMKQKESCVDHGGSLYPGTVPCSPLSYATVQWDAPEPSEAELDSVADPRFDWTLDHTSVDQDAAVDFVPEAESQADVTLASSQVCQWKRKGLVVLLVDMFLYPVTCFLSAVCVRCIICFYALLQLSLTTFNTYSIVCLNDLEYNFDLKRKMANVCLFEWN